MSETNKSFRIRTNVGQDSNITVNLDQSYNVFEILSVKLTEEDTYKLHSANYGVIVGRVLANEGFGVPNAKISVFIEGEFDESTTKEIAAIYPYSSTSDKNSDGVRYNLLPDNQSDDCHQVVGTFPNKTYMLDNDVIIDVFDKYYIYTTRTNNSGDYLICGVPTGNHTIHMDLDLSDCGILSQRPRDFVYKGYTIEQFENPNQFKTGTSLNSLSQVFSQDTVVNVIPFWGNEELGETIGITRADINVAFKFEPTCVFMGSLVADNASNGISKKCIPTNRMGAMDELTTGEGTIEMIRKTANGDVEEFQVKGTQVIDGNGVWCYQIPMNLDYMMTDEYGNMVPTDDPSKGIPTRARVRFRISMNDMEANTDNYFRAKVLVPHNPQTYVGDKGLEHEDYDYEFGTNTREDSFRDLFWNDVYTVKSYIPRFQKSKKSNTERFSGIKNCNIYGNNNPIPYNNIRIRMPFMFVIVCFLIKAFIKIVSIYNFFLSRIGNMLADLGNWGIVIPAADTHFIFWDIKKGSILSWMPFIRLYEHALALRLFVLEEGLCPDLDNWYFSPMWPSTYLWDFSGQIVPPGYPKYDLLEQTYYYLQGYERTETGYKKEKSKPVDDMTSTDYTNSSANDKETEPVCLTVNTDYLISCIEMNLAQEHKVINFDFYNDWVNGVIYMPRWMRFVRKKRTFLFGLIRIKPKVKACVDDSSLFGKTRYYTQQCALTYGKNDKKYTKITNHNGCMTRNNSKQQKCHKLRGLRTYSIFGSGNRKNDKGNGGIVHENPTLRNQFVYYFKPCEWRSSTGKKTILFANDIVLLGSLNECNIHGVPQAFKYLTSSSYVMPTNLALTNMDDDGYLYAAEDSGTICSESRNLNEDNQSLALGTVSQTFEGTQKYYAGSKEENVAYGTKGNDDLDTLNYDDTIPLTEAAGIAWNYSGPGQGEKSKNVTKSLYYPGGHFLGLSCVNSETNIKSCVNLQRICEIGSTESQRREEIRRVNYNQSTTESNVQYRYFVPTGLIAQDEITGSDFRSMFATMNHKRLLCTDRIDEKTGYPIYDFVYMKPIGFDGVLKDKVQKSQGYNTNVTPKDEQSFMREQGVSKSDDYDNLETTQTLTRTIEDTSEDYYMFRLGLNSLNDEEQKSRFLYSIGSTVALPQYENSYYFYFGLKEGATALDEFNKQFFSKCSPKSVFLETPKLTTEAFFSACTLKTNVEITVENMSAPATISIKNNTTNIMDVIGEPMQGKSIMYYTFENAEKGTYDIKVVDSENQTIERTIEVGNNVIQLDTEVANFEFKTRGLTEQKIITSGKTKSSGYISVETAFTIGNNIVYVNDDVTLALFDRTYVNNVINHNYTTSNNEVLSSDVLNQISEILNLSAQIDPEEVMGHHKKADWGSGTVSYDVVDGEGRFYVWKSDATYDLFIIHHCDEDGNDYAAYYETIIVNGCDNYDIYLGSKLLPYDGILSKYCSGNTWWEGITGGTGTEQVGEITVQKSELYWAMRHYLFRQTDDDSDTYTNNLISLNNAGREIDTALFGQPEQYNSQTQKYEIVGTKVYYEGDNVFDGDLSDESVIPTWPEEYVIDTYGNTKAVYGEMATYNNIIASDKIGIFEDVTLTDLGDGRIMISNITIPNNTVKDGHGCIVKLEDGTIVYPVRYGNDLIYYGEIPEGSIQTLSLFPIFYYPVMYRPFYAKAYMLDWVNARISTDSAVSEEPEAETDNESWVAYLDIFNGITYEDKFSTGSATTVNGIEAVITVPSDSDLGINPNSGYNNTRSFVMQKISDENTSGYTVDDFGFKITEGYPNFGVEKDLINSPYSFEPVAIDGYVANDFPLFINYKFNDFDEYVFVSDNDDSSADFYLYTGSTTYGSNCPLMKGKPVVLRKGSSYYILVRYNENATNRSSKNKLGETVIGELYTQFRIPGGLGVEFKIPMYTTEEATEMESVTYYESYVGFLNTYVNNLSNNTNAQNGLAGIGAEMVFTHTPISSYITSGSSSARTFIEEVKTSPQFRKLEGLGKSVDGLPAPDVLPSGYYIVGLKGEVSGEKGETNVARIYPRDTILRVRKYEMPSEPSIEIVPSGETGVYDVVTENSGTTFVVSGGSLEIRVKSTTNWKFRFAGEDTSWLQVNNGSTYNGNKNEYLRITASPNNTSTPKIASGIAETLVTHEVDIDGTVVSVPYSSYTIFRLMEKVDACYMDYLTVPTFSNGGETLGINVISNVSSSWTLTIQCEGDEWMKFSNGSNTMTGNGSTIVYVSANANPSASQRNANVTISPFTREGGIETGRVLEFVQNAATEELLITPTELTFNNSGTEEKYLDVICNGTWASSTDVGWLDLTDSYDRVTVKARPNQSGSRTGTVKVISGDLSKTAVIRQADGIEKQIVTQITFANGSSTIKYNEPNATMSITANTNWVLSSNVDWITFSKERGNGDDTVSISFSQNPNAARTGKIMVESLLSDCTPQPTEYTIIQENAPFRITVHNETRGVITQILIDDANGNFYEIDIEIPQGELEVVSLEGLESSVQSVNCRTWVIRLDRDLYDVPALSFCDAVGQLSQYGIYVCNNNFTITNGSNQYVRQTSI